MPHQLLLLGSVLSHIITHYSVCQEGNQVLQIVRFSWCYSNNATIKHMNFPCILAKGLVCIFAEHIGIVYSECYVFPTAMKSSCKVIIIIVPDLNEN